MEALLAQPRGWVALPSSVLCGPPSSTMSHLAFYWPLWLLKALWVGITTQLGSWTVSVSFCSHVIYPV